MGGFLGKPSVGDSFWDGSELTSASDFKGRERKKGTWEPLVNLPAMAKWSCERWVTRQKGRLGEVS